MRILIAGAGKVGMALTKELSEEGHDITIIDQRGWVLEDAMEKYDVITLEGNAASQRILEEAEVRKMDLFIAATNADEINMLACLTAHALAPNIKTIARIRDPEYVEQAYAMKDVFSLSLVINPERLAAREIAMLVKNPGFLKRESFAKAGVEIVELRIGADSKLVNVQLSKLAQRVRSQVLVAVVIREGRAIMPNGEFALRKDDRIFVTGRTEELHNMLTQIGIINMPINNVFITGGGRISYYLAEELQKNSIHSTIIDIDRQKCVALTEKLPNATIICGDVSDHSVLESEEISEYDAVVSMTGMDELNIVTSLYAHISHVPVVVTKLGRGESSELIDSLPMLGSVVCPKDLCTSHIVRYVRAMQNKTGAALTVHKIADGNALAYEFMVDADTRHVGEPMKNIRFKRNILVVSIGKGQNTMIPDGSASFRRGDTVVIVGDVTRSIQTLNDIFED